MSPEKSSGHSVVADGSRLLIHGPCEWQRGLRTRCHAPAPSRATRPASVRARDARPLQWRGGLSRQLSE
ncbi:hypothetical protein CURTO8I2_130071 [Curtobacterium sp. 8I-2]|nr:hypothetical protein CURTO8I2_130071 [Curtobacterium sp. 8I-2]